MCECILQQFHIQLLNAFILTIDSEKASCDRHIVKSTDTN